LSWCGVLGSAKFLERRAILSIGSSNEAFFMTSNIVKTDMPFAVFSMEADTDYLLARMIHFLGAGFHARAGFFAQQACEKYLKALSVQRTGTYAETHNLKDLAALCEPYDPYFSTKETRIVLEQFDLFDQIGRYGGAANFDPFRKGKTVGGTSLKIASGAQMAGAFIWPEKYLHDLDGFVYKARSLLDFAKINFDDGLKSILGRNRHSFLMSTWKGKMPLRVVLTKANRYFKS
jgi:HEPN domain-containing protein